MKKEMPNESDVKDGYREIKMYDADAATIEQLARIHNIDVPSMVNDLVNMGRKFYASRLK